MRTAIRGCSMPRDPEKPPIVVSPKRQLDCVNEKIAALATGTPYADVYGVFAHSGRLARQAVDIALELERLPGIDADQIQPVLNFWYRLADYSRTAALCCAGGNQTLAEALITYQFLLNSNEERRASDAR